ncbi:MAG: hypothetical protein ACOC3A_13075, partial [Thermodesulfobacteriota bacterium]
MAYDFQKFCRVFGAPEFLNEWIGRFFEPSEIDLVLLLAEGPLDPDTLGKRLAGRKAGLELPAFLNRAVRRGIL